MSSSRDEWWSELDPAAAVLFQGRGLADDPRLGEVASRLTGGPVGVHAGQPVLLGFPCDIGVVRNAGRAGAAQAPDSIRAELYRQTAWDQPTSTNLAQLRLLDLGNLRIGDDLACNQERLGRVTGHLLQSGAVPIILGGGHETTYGHYLAYVHGRQPCGILNVDAHLDVRPYEDGPHSGSPFRQAMEHPTQPLADGAYVVLGAQRQSVARTHVELLARRGCRIIWHDPRMSEEDALRLFDHEVERLAQAHRTVLLTVDADAFAQADVPGVSAPSPIGWRGALWPMMAEHAGRSPAITSLDLVEVNPVHDWDRQTARWAALGIRQFLVGLAGRGEPTVPSP